MRYAILASALVASTHAVPILDIFTQYAYVTDIVTVTAGAEPTPTPQETTIAAVPTTNWFEQYWQPTTSVPPPAPTTTVAPKPKKVYTPPAPQVETVWVAPQPTTSSAPPPSPSPEKAAPAVNVQSYSSDPKSTPKKASKPAVQEDYGSDPSFEDIVVMHHNIHRANHSAAPIKWSPTLAATAQKIGELCQYEHNVVMDNGGYGQNIAAGAPKDNISSIITDKFYNSEMPNFQPFYDEATPSDMSDPTFDSFGHFTQIVWKGTTHVGCAVVDCTGRGNGPQGLGLVADNVQPFFTVCNYGPPGNYLGEFADNVKRPEGKANENWSYGL